MYRGYGTLDWKQFSSFLAAVKVNCNALQAERRKPLYCSKDGLIVEYHLCYSIRLYFRFKSQSILPLPTLATGEPYSWCSSTFPCMPQVWPSPKRRFTTPLAIPLIRHLMINYNNVREIHRILVWQNYNNRELLSNLPRDQRYLTFHCILPLSCRLDSTFL